MGVWYKMTWNPFYVAFVSARQTLESVWLHHERLLSLPDSNANPPNQAVESGREACGSLASLSLRIEHLLLSLSPPLVCSVKTCSSLQMIRVAEVPHSLACACLWCWYLWTDLVLVWLHSCVALLLESYEAILWCLTLWFLVEDWALRTTYHSCVRSPVASLFALLLETQGTRFEQHDLASASTCCLKQSEVPCRGTQTKYRVDRVLGIDTKPPCC